MKTSLRSLAIPSPTERRVRRSLEAVVPLLNLQSGYAMTCTINLCCCQVLCCPPLYGRRLTFYDMLVMLLSDLVSWVSRMISRVSQMISSLVSMVSRAVSSLVSSVSQFFSSPAAETTTAETELTAVVAVAVPSEASEREQEIKDAEEFKQRCAADRAQRARVHGNRAQRERVHAKTVARTEVSTAREQGQLETEDLAPMMLSSC